MKWNGMNEMKRNRIKWSEMMKQNEMGWHGMEENKIKWTKGMKYMKWNERKEWMGGWVDGAMGRWGGWMDT